MAVAHVTEFDVVENDRSVAHYDAVAARVRIEEEPPPGLLLHAVGFAGGVFRIVDVWEDEAQAQAFADARLAPILAALEPELAAPAGQRSHTYELHHVVAPRG